jgi:Protein of unknown function (DUF3631)/Bifunctional DNA primase/polymerase, N-terminal/Primase C terminal 1 (PriCT-1)
MWWRSWPTANIGLLTGAGLLVLDIDRRNGGNEALLELIARHGELPPTPTVATGGGGRHFYFAVAGAVQCRNGVVPGIDVKCDGGYVIAPDSIHASGEAYTWLRGKSLDDLPLAVVPSFVLKLLSQARIGPRFETGGTRIETRNGGFETGGTPTGGRNSHLISVAGRMRREGLGGVGLRDALQAENEAACKPPLDPAEVARVAASAERYPAPGGARSVADVLTASGVTSLGEASSVAEREEAARRLKIAVSSLDVTGRAVLRDELVRRLGFSAGVADSILQQAKAGDSKLQGGAMLFTDPEPWPEPVAGAALLAELLVTIEAYVVLPRPSSLAIAVWILHTHALDAAQISPRLAIISPEKRCGKSTVLKLLGALVRRPLQTTNVTTAVVFRAIEAYQPTLLVDEADTFLRDHDELRGVLNAGHDRQSARVARCVGDDSEPRVFAVWAPVAFAGIGKQHDTLMDRSVVIAMKRRSGSEKVAPFRRAQREALGALHRRCTRWATDNLDQLRVAAPVAVPGLDDRAVDNWEALLAIADAAGAAWPEQVRMAAQALSSAERGGQGDAHGELLLADVRDIFTEAAATAIPAKALLECLLGMDERPWPEASRGRPLTARQLGIRLGRFGIGSCTVRTGSTTARCYVRSDFDDAFSRYLADQSVLRVTAAESDANLAESEPSRLRPVTDATPAEKPRDLAGVTDVTDAEDEEAAYVALERAAIKDFGS